MDKKARFNIWYTIAVLFVLMTIHNLVTNTAKTETIPYSQFEKLLEEDRIEEIFVNENTLTGTLKNPSKWEKPRFVTARVDGQIAQLIRGRDVKVTGMVQNSFLREILALILPALVFVGIWILAMRFFAKKGGGLGGSFMSVGKSKAKVYVETDTKKSFDDVAGADEAKSELQEVIHFLKEPAKFAKFGARMPKGILLVGPPGTGKTLLAKAVAGEGGVPFFSISGSEFVEMFVGVGAARVRDLFEKARQKAPCIVFIDELDALGKSRAQNMGGGHDEKEQTLNQLLVELDGFDSSTGIVLLAATNRPEVLDPALLRSGRFDRQVLVDRPDKIGRIEILKVHLKNKKNVDHKLSLDTIASLTTGFSGADLENLVNEAALAATRRGSERIELLDFNQAVERIVAGLERKNRVLNSHEREVVAYHEMGHAIVGKALHTGEKLHKVSIIPRGIGALGYTMQRPTEDRFLMSRYELEAKIAVLLGGRAAEVVKFGHFSTGAADDISKATNIARSMVAKYGMSDKIGFVDHDGENQGFLGGGPKGPSLTSQVTAREIDEEIAHIIESCYNKAKKIVEKNRAALELSSQKLLEKETLDEKDLDSLLIEVANEKVTTINAHKKSQLTKEP